MFYVIFALIIISFNTFKIDFDLEDFVKLYSLQGEWSTPFKEGELIEKWQKRYEKMLEGSTIYFKGNEKLSEEKINLILRDGRIFYTPSLKDHNNEEPVPFTLVEIDKSKFTFENKDNDFPQRIIYEIKSTNELIATIEGDTRNGFKKIEYKFSRKNNEEKN